MDNELKAAKTYLLNEEWHLAKELLLKIHLKHKLNTSILCKLGDCCMKLNEYDLAKQCYTKCINYDNYYYQQKNAKYYLKLAHLTQFYYDPYLIEKSDLEQLHESQSLYQEILQFNNLNNKYKTKCYFNYAQLLTKLKEYNLAKTYYDKLIKLMEITNLYHLNKNGSSLIHYYYGKLLFFMHGNENDSASKNNIYYHFERAINLKPDIIKYYYKYSNILSSFGDNNKSSSILSRAHQIELEFEQNDDNDDDEDEYEEDEYEELEEEKEDLDDDQFCDKFLYKKSVNNNNNIDEIELFITMTATNTHIAHKYINLSNGDLNRAINIFIEDQEKREKRKKESSQNKWRTVSDKNNKNNKNNKKKRKRKNNKKKEIVEIEEKKEEKEKKEKKEIEKEIIKKREIKPLPPIVFDDIDSIKRISTIKMIIFSIGTLAYLHSFKANKKMSKENIYHTDTLYVLDMFGGRDRIERLKEFFENIQILGIKMCIISSSEKSEMIAEALRRVHLFNFFKSSIIAGREVINEIKPKINIETGIAINKKLIFISNLLIKKKFNYKNILLVDNKISDGDASNICYSICIDHGFEFLLETDLKRIEKTIGVKNRGSSGSYNKLKIITYPLNLSLSEINYVLYKDIKFEIINNGNQYIGNNGCNDDLLNKYISYKTKCLSVLERQCFFYFFKKFKLLQDSQHLHQSWIVLNLCFELMNIETCDSDLCRSLAMALSEYQYFVDAEYYFKKSLEIFPTNITSLKAYAYFLFMLERYDESSDIFEKALEINPISKKAILGYARSLSFLKEHEKAEEYFKKCIQYYCEWDLAHFRYGKFLYLLERYQEAKHYLLNAVQIWSHSARSHLYLAQCYDKLGDIEEFEFHLNEALKLEPEHHEAINKWERHYCKTYNASYFRKKKFVKQAPKIRPNKYNWDYCETEEIENNENKVYKKEFETFWWNHVWFNNEKKKNEYIARFINTNLNDIRLILFEKDISTILRSQVGITSNNDIKYILDAIEKYKNQYKLFKEWLNKIKLSKEYQIIFEKNAIYCLQTLFKKIKSINNLIQILGKEQEMTATYIWKQIQNEKKICIKQENQNQQQNQQQNHAQNQHRNYHHHHHHHRNRYQYKKNYNHHHHNHHNHHNSYK